MSEPIRVWEFHNAPDELKYCSHCGGDEDFIVLVPPGMDCPWRLAELGCCSNDVFRVASGGKAEIRRELIGDDHEDFKWQDTGYHCPNFIGHTFIISSHA